MKALLWLAVCAAAISLTGNRALATSASLVLEGAIVSYECGDNCYLTIRTSYGKEVAGLCAARACSRWNDKAEMPTRFRGRRVSVTIEKGTRVDGNLDAIDDFPAFSTLTFLK